MAHKGKNRKIFVILAISLIAMFCVGLIDYAFAQTGIEFLNIQAENVDGKTVKIKWSTNIISKGKILYGKSSDNLNCYLIDGKGLLKHHEMLIGNLESETIYYFQIIASNNDERVYSFIRDFETSEHHDKIAPKISELRAPYVSGTAAVITWQTDEEGTSVVEYDQHETYKKSAGSRTKTTDHLIILRNLTLNTRYYFRVYSVDKDNNKSNFFHKELRTLESDKIDKEDLIISYFRPSNPDDSNITNTSVTVNFKTNHWAKGSVKLTKRGHRTQTKNLEYGLNHQVIFDGLFSDSEYNLSVSMKDIFNKKDEVKSYTVKTAKIPPIKAIPADDIVDFSILSCSNEILNLSGYYGQYFNLPNNLPHINKLDANGEGENTGWFDKQYLSFSRIDSNLSFAGYNFLPINNEGLAGDPFYFSVYWRAILEVLEDGVYEYKISVDNSGWVYLDNVLVTDLGQRLPFQTDSHRLNLSKGLHSIEIYFVERGPSKSYFDFNIDSRIKAHPWPEDCSFLSGQIGISGNNHDHVAVLGAEYFLYTQVSALYKTFDSPDIYAIVNGQRHYISSPASFREYGYSWADVKTVSWAELSQYPRARLIKSPDSSTIYYLYQRQEGQWLKIAIPSPTAFVSYSENFWGNVITVTKFDIGSYPDVKLIRTANDPAVYYLENNIKHFISKQVFKQRDFSIPEIAEVSQIHLNTYKTGSLLK